MPRHDTRHIASTRLTTRIKAISPTEIFKVIDKRFLLHANFATKSSLQVPYKSVAMFSFHECARYTTKYNILSTLGNFTSCGTASVQTAFAALTSEVVK